MGISALITRGIHNKSLRKPKREEIRDVVSAEEWEEPQVESSTRATQNRSTGSKWLDKILNWDQTHIKAIMLKKRGIAKWSDGAWRTKNGADVTMWLETKAKKKWLQMKWYHSGRNISDTFPERKCRQTKIWRRWTITVQDNEGNWRSIGKRTKEIRQTSKVAMKGFMVL